MLVCWQSLTCGHRQYYALTCFANGVSVWHSIFLQALQQYKENRNKVSWQEQRADEMRLGCYSIKLYNGKFAFCLS